MMCDIYTDNCVVCDREIEMHLGDFETERDEVAVNCCIMEPDPSDSPYGSTVWKITDMDDMDDFPKKVRVMHLTEAALAMRHDNHPNTGCVIIDHFKPKPVEPKTTEDKREETARFVHMMRIRSRQYQEYPSTNPWRHREQ